MAELPPTYGINRLRETLVVKEAVRRSMQGNRSRETAPERALRRALWEAGARGYRKNFRGLPGAPDVAFVRRRVVVFVHGCFWHGCPICALPCPKTNAAFWSAKVKANQDRHTRVEHTLGSLGFTVLTMWECEIRRESRACAERVVRELGAHRQC